MEYTLNSNPQDSDTDGDYIDDSWEYEYGLDLLSFDSNLDNDSDNLSNLDEYNANTNPNNNDTDGDGLNDEVEVNLYSCSPLICDSDEDGINDYDEIMVYETNPVEIDTDDDGMGDLFEINNGLDPKDDSDKYGDLDNDELKNFDEFELGTDPNKKDTDNDGLSDGEEYHNYQTDPTKKDTDGDSYLDNEEVKYFSDPNDPKDTPLSHFIYVGIIVAAFISLYVIRKHQIKKYGKIDQDFINSQEYQESNKEPQSWGSGNNYLNKHRYRYSDGAIPGEVHVRGNLPSRNYDESPDSNISEYDDEKLNSYEFGDTLGGYYDNDDKLNQTKEENLNWDSTSSFGTKDNNYKKEKLKNSVFSSSTLHQQEDNSKDEIEESFCPICGGKIKNGKCTRCYIDFN